MKVRRYWVWLHVQGLGGWRVSGEVYAEDERGAWREVYADKVFAKIGKADKGRLRVELSTPESEDRVADNLSGHLSARPLEGKPV